MPPPMGYGRNSVTALACSARRSGDQFPMQ